MPAADSLKFVTDLEQQSNRYIDFLRRIDSILRDPVQTLCEAAGKSVSNTPGRPEFPVWIGREGATYSRDNKLTQALCCATVQMLYADRHRFEWLDKIKLFQTEKAEKTVERWAASAFVPEPYSPSAAHPAAAKQKFFRSCVETLRSDTFGGLNPLTSAQVFRVLMGAGEDHAHEGIGFLAFFCMVWPLYRRYPDPMNIGAGVEPSGPTAYVTAKSVLTLDLLRRICSTRAELLTHIARNLVKLEELRAPREEFENRLAAWEITAELERLRTHLTRLAPIAIARDAFATCATRVGEVSDDIHLTPPGGLQTLVDEFCTALREVKNKTDSAVAEAEVIIECIRNEIVARLAPVDDPATDTLHELESEPYCMLFAPRPMRDLSHYRNDLVRSAHEALTLCSLAVDQLRVAVAEPEPAGGATLTWVAEQLKVLATANREIAKGMSECMRLPSEWCRSIMEREIAYASARNLSDFDVAELASAIAVTVKGKLVNSTLQVRNAIEKAVLGAEEDGSWRLGHTYFSRDGVMGARPSSADTVWTLVATLFAHPEIKVADRALFRFVQWLERTLKSVSTADGGVATGWGMDRHRQGDRIHLLTTAAAINALIDIRALVEHRIWQLCKRRFTVLPLTSNLSSIDPVDMGVQHRHRLHRTLAQMARDTRNPQADNDASYSMVLHGPPGSSKTALTNALASDMWHLPISSRLRDSKLVRITPADFTRMGEDRIDAEARLIFQLLTNIRGVTILFDEIDDLLLQRSRQPAERPRFLDLVVPAMLNRLQDLRDACPRQEICFFFGTNYIDNIEPALLRPGRVDRHLPVVYPDHASRLLLAAKHLRPALPPEGGHPDQRRAVATWLERWCRTLASETAGWSWNDIKRSLKSLGVRQQVEAALREALDHVGNRPLPRASGSTLASPARKNADRCLRDVERKLKIQFKERGRQISAPAYGSRLKNHALRPELRREYIQYVLSLRTDFSDCDAIVAAEKKVFTGFGGTTAEVLDEFLKEMRDEVDLRAPSGRDGR
jgi:hypothetical protein